MNNLRKTRICIFLHHSDLEQLPYYVRLYIEELSIYFDKVVVLSNNANLKSTDYFPGNNIDFVYQVNRGYDFGKFYTYVISQNLQHYSQIAIVNDSNILLKKLDPFFITDDNDEPDFWGMIDSYEKPWFSTHPDNYHIQSHFIVLNKKAIDLLPVFFQKTDIESIMNESNMVEVRRKVINDWEIGLSQFFLKNGLKLHSMFHSKDIQLKYKSKKRNVANALYYQLAKEGYPLLKRKTVLAKNKWYERKTETWQQTILDFMNPGWNSHKLIEELDDWSKMQRKVER